MRASETAFDVTNDFFRYNGGKRRSAIERAYAGGGGPSLGA